MVLQGGAILFVVRKKPGACSVATWCAAFFHFILPAFFAGLPAHLRRIWQQGGWYISLIASFARYFYIYVNIPIGRLPTNSIKVYDTPIYDFYTTPFLLAIWQYGLFAHSGFQQFGRKVVKMFHV